MTAPLSSSQFSRQLQSRPEKTPVATPTGGRNPYAQQWGLPPDDEIRRLVKKHSVPPKRGRKKREKFSEFEIGRMAECDPSGFRNFMLGANSLSRKALMRLCKLLKQLDDGWIVKIDGWPVMLFEPTDTAEEVRFHIGVTVDRNGRIAHAVSMGNGMPAPKTMPRLFKELKSGSRS